MNSVQLHLALTHVPVILSLVGFIMLVIALLIKNTTLTKTSYILIIVAGVTALPVFFTGEGAEEAIERLPGVSETVIEKHEDVAKLAMISIAVSGLVALVSLFTFRWQVAAWFSKILVLLLVIATGVLMGQTAHLGGQIRHTEIRSDIAMQNGIEANSVDDSRNINEEEDDD